jgi:hypothetical protein
VSEFQPFSIGREDDSVITHHITSSQRVNSYLRARPLARNALAAVAQGVAELQLSNVTQNLEQRGRCAARRIHFQSMMHFDHLQIKTGSENLSRFAGEPEERVDAGGIVACPHHWDEIRTGDDLAFLHVGMTGCSNDERLLVLRANGRHARGDIVIAEVDDYLAHWKECV